MTAKVSYLDYHGTFKDCIPSIMAKGFEAQVRNDHWLGQGFYFFEYEGLARWWILKKRDNSSTCRDRKVAVLKVTVEVNHEQVLDLDHPGQMDYFLQYIAEKIHEGSINITFSKNNEHKNRCFFIDLISVERDIKVIIYTFKKDHPTYGMYDTKKFSGNFLNIGLQYSEKQICVKDNGSIVEKELAYEEDDIRISLPLRRKRYGKFK